MGAMTSRNCIDPRLTCRLKKGRQAAFTLIELLVVIAIIAILAALLLPALTRANSPWPMFQQNARHTGKIERPSLQHPSRRPDANFDFQLFAQIDQTQAVQVSSDLVTWSTLTNVVVTNIPFSVADLSATNSVSRFYRVLSQ